MLQIQTVKPDCLALLDELMALDDLKQFRLAGGTALSLRLGHRISIDLDFFTNEKFEIESINLFLTQTFKHRLSITGSSKYGLFVKIDSIKVDFLHRYEKFLTPFETIQKMRFASITDIAAMKVHAACNRASKKNYFDLFELLKQFSC